MSETFPESQKLARLSLVLGTEFNECSIASAELARRAEELITNPEYIIPGELTLIENNGSSVVTLDTVPVSPLFPTRGGRQVQLVLARNNSDPDPERHIRLLAVTRGDIAFPVAAFARRVGSACDYVQFGPEMSDESLVVTPPEEYKRKDLVEAMRNLLEADMRFMAQGHLIAEYAQQLPYDSAYGFVDNFLKFNGYHEHFKKDGGEVFAAFGLNNSTSDKLCLLTTTGRYKYRKAKSRVREFLENPDLEQIFDGTAPGCAYPEVRHMLVAEVIKRYGIDEENFKPDLAIKFADLYGLDRQIDERLGAYSGPAERLIALLGKSTNLTEVMVTEEDTLIGNTKADADIVVSVNEIDRTTRRVDVRSRPSAQPDHQFSSVYDIIIDRASELDLSPTEIPDVIYLLGKAAIVAQPQPKAKTKIES